VETLISTDKKYAHSNLVVHEKGGFHLHYSMGVGRVEDLIREYREILKWVRDRKKQYPPRGERTPQEMEDYRILGSMERDLQYVIRWLKTGRRPDNLRGVERLAAYQREILFDPLWFRTQPFSQPLYPPAEKEIPEPVRYLLDDVLRNLSPREREVYELSRGEGFTSEEIGDMLGITSGAVRTMIRRAEAKIRKQTENGLSCIG